MESQAMHVDPDTKSPGPHDGWFGLTTPLLAESTRAGARLARTERLAAGSATVAPARLRAWRPSPPNVFDVVCEETAVWAQRVHAHEEFEIVLPFAPLCVVDGAGKREQLEPGCIGVVNPGELHGLLSIGPEPASAGTLLIARDAMSCASPGARGRSPSSTPWFPGRVVADAGLAAELHALFDELRRPLTISGCKPRLRSCLAQLIHRYASSPPPPASPRHRHAARRVRDYLRANVVERVSIGDLSRVAGLSKHYLLRVFAREYGLSPHAYQSELRLARARTLLARGASPSFAAYEAGFADQSHLTRRMKSALGTTPAAYARHFSAHAPDSRRAFGWARARAVPSAA